MLHASLLPETQCCLPKHVTIAEQDPIAWKASTQFLDVLDVSRVGLSMRCFSHDYVCSATCVTCFGCRVLFFFLKALEHLHERRIVHRADLRAATQSDFPTNGLAYERSWRNRTRIRKNMLRRCERSGNNFTSQQRTQSARWHQARKCTAWWERLCQGSLPVLMDVVKVNF